MSTTHWYPGHIFYGQNIRNKKHGDFSILVLNQELTLPTQTYRKVWDNSTIVVAADGGANRVFEINARESEQRVNAKNLEELDLDIIIGDLDSLEQGPKEYWQSKGSQLIHDSDQYSTDFHKAVSFLRKWDKQSQRAYIECKKHKGQTCRLDISAAITEQDKMVLAKEVLSGGNRDIVVIGGLGGRLDQGMSTLHHMYFFQSHPTYGQGKMFLLSSENITIVLKAGKHKIKVKNPWLGEHIGIIPMREPSTITTEGLKWDVSDWITGFGGQMSTSNHIREDYVSIETSHDVLFTIDLKAPPPQQNGSVVDGVLEDVESDNEDLGCE